MLALVESGKPLDPGVGAKPLHPGLDGAKRLDAGVDDAKRLDTAARARAGPLERLALASRGGDRAAIRALLEAMAPQLLGVARAILGAGSPDVEDVAQESLIAFFRALGSFRGESSVKHFGCRIAARIAIASRRRAREGQDRLSEMDRASAPLDVLLGSVDAEALARRRRELLRALLEELPEAQAEVLALRVVLGCELGEVAAATGAPLNTVRSRLRLAKDALRKRIEADASAAEILEDEP